MKYPCPNAKGLEKKNLIYFQRYSGNLSVFESYLSTNCVSLILIRCSPQLNFVVLGIIHRYDTAYSSELRFNSSILVFCGLPHN